MPIGRLLGSRMVLTAAACLGLAGAASGANSYADNLQDPILVQAARSLEACFDEEKAAHPERAASIERARQQWRQKWEARLATFDRNRDGRLDANEQAEAGAQINKHRERLRAALDADGDDWVSVEELVRGNPEAADSLRASLARLRDDLSNPSSARAKIYDMDKNGKLDSFERQLALDTWVRRQLIVAIIFDNNTDGKLDLGERQALAVVAADLYGR